MNGLNGDSGEPFLTVASALLAAGLCVVPSTARKHPVVSSNPDLNKWQRYQNMLPVADELDEWFSGHSIPVYGIGLVCGLISGGLEVVDLDAKHDPTKTLNDRAEKAIREFAPGLWEKLVIETTPSGGMHLYFRCALPAKNLKLAYCLNDKGERRAVAETRGEGGFIMAAPSPGYVLVQGQLTAIPLITDDDRSALFAAARSLDTAPLPAVPEKPVVNTRARTDFPSSGNRPGDDYNASDKFMDELLRPIGWTTHDEKHWTRPGKTIAEGNSANWDTQEKFPRHFYCFTPNAPPLEDDKNYTPFSLYAVLKCGGDMTQAARELGEQGFGAPAKVRQRAPDIDPDIQAQLDAEEEARGANGTGNQSHLMPGDRFLDDGGHVSAAPDPTKSPLPDGWPAPISAADLCAKPPPKPEVLVEGILYAGGTMLVAGPSKSMKTFSALDVAIAIASGGKWMGRQCVKAPVLYLNLELQDFATEERIAKICSARGIEPPANLHVWNLRGKTVTMAVLARCLPFFITLHGCKIACIDPHYKVSSVSDMEENSNDSQGKLLTLLEGLCAQAGAALAITHHFAKGDAGAKNAIDRASGGGVFARWGDVMMTFTPHEEGDAMTVEMALRNFAPVKPFVVRWEYPRWVRDDSLDPAKLKKKPGTFQEKYSTDDLLLVLGDQLLTNSEWEKRSKMARSTYYKKRSELLESKRVEQIGSCYRKC